MKFELIELAGMSGDKTKIYSPIIEGEDITLFEKFVTDNSDTHFKEVQNLFDRIEGIGNDCGLFEDFFDTKAGRFGENICTFKDRPKSFLRLFFIEYGNKPNGIPAIILGSGGAKPKSAKATEDVPKLDDENKKLGLISSLQKAEKAGHFKINNDGSMFSTTKFIYDSETYG